VKGGDDGGWCCGSLTGAQGVVSIIFVAAAMYDNWLEGGDEVFVCKATTCVFGGS